MRRTANGYLSTDASHRTTRESGAHLISILVAMLVIMSLAGVVVLYVAFPHRGEEMPHAPWVGDAMRKGVEMLPTLDNQQERERQTSDA